MVEELFTYTTFRDIALEIKEEVKRANVTADEIFRQYDVDKSFLLSYKEISKFCRDVNIPLDKADV